MPYRWICALTLSLSLTACVEPVESVIVDTDTPRPDYGYPLDQTLRVNHIQAKGTHNSYHLRSPEPADPSHDYDQPSLTDQLELYGIRQVELDVHYIADEGYTVFHIPTIDELSSCRLFADCLAELKAWSDANAGHHILFVWVEIKDMLDADKIDNWDDFDAAIRKVWPEDRLLTPDDVQRDYPTLREALAAEGWPSLGDTRDHIMFMLNNGERAEEYAHDGQSLAGRVMFVNAGMDHDLTAIWKHGDDAEQQAALDRQYLLGDNAAGAGSTETEATTEVEAAWARGVNFLAVDYPAPVSGWSFEFILPEGSPSRCNPKTAPADCRSTDIEDLARLGR